MNKAGFQANLPVIFFKEGGSFIAYSPALDLSTSGQTMEQAKCRFNEAATAFFEEIIGRGTLDEALSELGWKKQQKEWHAPTMVGQTTERVNVPVAA